MSAELIMRSAGVLACATTLSLFTTIAAYAAVSVAPLKWDGSFCTNKECAAAVAFTPEKAPGRHKVAQLAAKAS